MHCPLSGKKYTFQNNRLKDILFKLKLLKHKIISVHALSRRKYNAATSHLYGTSAHLNLTVVL